MPRTSHDFRFPARSRLGALLLLLVILAGLVAWRCLPLLLPQREDPETRALQRSWAVFRQQYASKAPEEKQSRTTGARETAAPVSAAEVHLFFFDPNTATEQELQQLGLPAYTVRTIIKYRAKSPHTFKTAADLKKLYTLRAQDYERIAPYVRIPQAGAAAAAPASPEKQRQASTIELNAATPEQLMALRGIGPVLSARIIRFRDALGGFYEVGQLREVYGLPDSTYQQLYQQFTVNVTLLKQININIADETTLAHHAYIGKRLAAEIVRLRGRLQLFKQTDDLKQIPLINDEKYRKIAPYLSTH